MHTTIESENKPLSNHDVSEFIIIIDSGSGLLLDWHKTVDQTNINAPFLHMN